jgi:hypothetical protein
MEARARSEGVTRRTLAAAGLIVLVAGAVAAVTVTRRSAEQKAQCHIEATELRQWMEQLDAEGGGGGELPLPKGMKLVALDERAGGGSTGPVIALDGESILLDGSAAGSLRDPDQAAQQLAQGLADKGRLWRQTHPGKSYAPAAPTMGIGSAVPWSRVATLVDVAARAGITDVWFVFDGTTKLTPPPETDVSRALREALSGEAVDPSQTARIAQEHDSPVRRVYANCQQVGQALEPLGQESADPAQKNAAFLKAIPSGIEACGCSVDLNAVKAVQWARYDRYRGTPKVFRQLSIAPRGTNGATPLTTRPDEPWSQAHARVLDASKRGAKVYFSSE